MKGIIVEDIEGLEAAAGATAMALVWEDRVVIDSQLRESPYFRRRILKHELKHFLYVRKHGMTRKAGRRNILLDQTYRFTLGLNFYIGAFLDRRRASK